jgi:hypothetical protein
MTNLFKATQSEPERIQIAAKYFHSLLHSLQEAGRKELWPSDEKARAEAVT